MTEAPENTRTPVENPSVTNWRAALAGLPRQGVIEAPLHTDLHITAMTADVGPYTFINTRAYGPHPSGLKPAIMMRIALHAPEIAPHDAMKAGAEHYHGGDFLDELAALASLFLNARIQTGGVERRFEEGGDPMGDPARYAQRPLPTLASGEMQLPRMRGTRAMSELERMAAVIDGAPARTIALVKAARLYQQAVWIADADPSSAWLLLVSAVETMAEIWDAGELPAKERLQRWMPPLYELLEKKAPDVLDEAAAILAKRTRATRKFIDFITTFAPPAPEVRPLDWLRFKFDERSIKTAAEKIYDHRSNALHAGIPFPLPMCNPPKRVHFDNKEDTTYQEIPLGLGASARGASWTADETPLLLHTFEYIARHAILNFWASAVSAKES